MTTTITHTMNASFEEQYIALRKKEGRICSDEELIHLPDVLPGHPHFNEWLARKESTHRLRHYMGKKKPPQKVLELGCGNGWLSHRLSCLQRCEVTGTDVNQTELEQARRVFAHAPNLHFVQGGIDAEELKGKGFDLIVLASCVQYFPELNTILSLCLQKLKKAGELHILDSPFYKPAEKEAARLRTVNYFKEMGFPAMASHYHHHSLSDLQSFHYEILYQPTYWGKHLLKYKNPFPWVRITSTAPDS